MGLDWAFISWQPRITGIFYNFLSEMVDSRKPKQLDNLDFLYPPSGVGRRTAIWLWSMALLNTEDVSSLLNFGKPNIRQDIYNALEKRGLVTPNILSLPIFLPEEGFEWIENNGRQPAWLVRIFSERVQIHFPSGIHGITSKEKLLLLFDCWMTSFSEKLAALRELKKEWVQRQFEEKKFHWYADSGQEKQRCQFAWMWYKENHQFFCTTTPEFSKLSDVLSFLDAAGFDHGEKLHHLIEIKKKYKARQTYANRQGKKQTNISLTEETRQQLDELAKKERCTRTELIELLIQRAYKEGMSH